MVSKKVAKKTTASKKVASKTPARKKVAAKKGAATGASRSSGVFVLDEARLAEARELYAQRLAEGKTLQSADWETIAHLLQQIGRDIEEIIILLTRGSGG